VEHTAVWRLVFSAGLKEYPYSFALKLALLTPSTHNTPNIVIVVIIVVIAGPRFVLLLKNSW
jgi:hypothetical protein